MQLFCDERSADALRRYNEYLQAGYPIASGVIEGACRHVIKDRMENGGMRWTLAGAKAMLNVRSVLASTELEKFNSTGGGQRKKLNECIRTGTLIVNPNDLKA